MNYIENAFKCWFPSEHKNLISNVNSVHIHESGKNAKVTDVDWVNGNFLLFRQNIITQLGSFFKKNQCLEIFDLDCDSLMMFEHNGEKYLFFTEIKSSFNFSEIAHAKSQIFSSYIKLNMLLNLIENYRNENIIVKGFIVSKAPTAEDKTHIKDYNNLPYDKQIKKPQIGFCQKLIRNSKSGFLLTPGNSYHLSPLNLNNRGIFPKITLHHIAVPESDSSIVLNALDYV